MRWKGLVFLIILFLAILLLGFIFSDKWIEKRIENLASSINGARVEIDNLDFSILQAHLRWDSLQVTDPKNTWSNMLTSGRADFDLKVLPLLQKKVHIENLQLTNISSGTARTTDGKIEKKKAQQSGPGIFAKTASRLQREIEQTPAWNFAEYAKSVNLDSVLALVNLQAPAKIDSLQEAIEKKYQEWDSLYKSRNWDDRFGQIKVGINSLENADTQSLQGLTAALSQLNRTRNELDSLKNDFERTGASLKVDLADAYNKIGLVDNWIEADYDQALKKARIPTLSAQNVGQFIFGGRIVNTLSKVFGIIGTIRYYGSKIPEGTPKEQRPARLKGQNIYVGGPGAQPDFWIKKGSLSGVTQKGLRLAGVIENIATNQRLTGAPSRIEMSGSRLDGATMKIKGEFDYLGESPTEKMSIEMNAVPLKNVALGESTLLPNKLQQGRGNLMAGLSVVADSIAADINFTGSNLRFDFNRAAGKDDILSTTIQNLLKNTSSLEFQAKVRSNEETTNFDVSSNLDDLLGRKIKTMLSDRVLESRERIRSYIDNQLGPQKQELETLIGQQTSAAQEKLAGLEDELNNYQDLVERNKKQIEQKIDQEKNKAKGKLENRLKGLIP